MDKIALCCVVISALCNATIGVFSKLSGLSPELITISRLFIGALFVLFFLFFSRKTFLLCRWPTMPVLSNGILLSGFMFFYVEAMNYTTMANAIMLVYMAPVAAAILAHFFLKESLTWTSGALICLALLGFAMMMEFKLDFGGQSQEIIGIGYGLLALLCYSGFMILNRAIKPQLPVYTRTFWQLMVGAFLLLPVSISSFPELTVLHIPWLLGVGLIPGFLGIFTAVFALSRLPATTFATLSYFEAVVVLFWGWLLFDETLSGLQIAGCLFIISSGLIKTLISVKTSMPVNNDGVLPLQSETSENAL